MLKFLGVFAVLFALNSYAQEATVDVSLSPAGSFVGKTADIKGTAIMKGDMVEAQNIIVSLKDLKTGIKLRDEHTQKHLDTAKFPEAVLVSATGKDGKGEGILKIRGIEKKVTGTYTIEGGVLKAEFPIKFSEYNITGIKYMGVGVQDDGKIKVSVPIKK